MATLDILDTRSGEVSNATSATVTFGTTVSGNSMVVLAAQYNNTFDGTEVSDEFGNSWQVARLHNTNPGATDDVFCAIFYCSNITGGATHQVTLTPGGASQFAQFSVLYVEGKISLDKVNSNEGTGTTATPGSTGTLTVATELAVKVVAIGVGASTMSLSAGWTQIDEDETISTSIPWQSARLAVSATTALNPSTTVQASRSWVNAIATFMAAGPDTFTPSTASLTLTTFAPTVTVDAGNQTVTPATASLTLTAFAPTVTASDHQTVTPATASLTLTTFEPTVTVSADQTVTPGTASLSLTAFAPTVSVTDHQTVTPSTLSLTLTTFEPTVSVDADSGAVEVTPEPASLTLTAFAPSVEITEPEPEPAPPIILPGAGGRSLPWWLQGQPRRKLDKIHREVASPITLSVALFARARYAQVAKPEPIAVLVDFEMEARYLTPVMVLKETYEAEKAGYEQRIAELEEDLAELAQALLQTV